MQSCHCFNSQRDGILLGKISATRANYFCFNSQRDGILRSLKCSRIGELGRFQFPTGWNSTIGQKTRARKSIVSIPNGMEFYPIEQVSFTLGHTFQFPTGWNSTFYAILALSFFAMFQFPTGWNSTQLYIHFVKKEHVSIPNGMEFYYTKLYLNYYPKCFNSQRDGILPAAVCVDTASAAGFNSQRDGILP